MKSRPPPPAAFPSTCQPGGKTDPGAAPGVLRSHVPGTHLRQGHLPSQKGLSPTHGHVRRGPAPLPAASGSNPPGKHPGKHISDSPGARSCQLPLLCQGAPRGAAAVPGDGREGRGGGGSGEADGAGRGAARAAEPLLTGTCSQTDTSSSSSTFTGSGSRERAARGSDGRFRLFNLSRGRGTSRPQPLHLRQRRGHRTHSFVPLLLRPSSQPFEGWAARRSWRRLPRTPREPFPFPQARPRLLPGGSRLPAGSRAGIPHRRPPVTPGQGRRTAAHRGIYAAVASRGRGDFIPAAGLPRSQLPGRAAGPAPFAIQGRPCARARTESSPGEAGTDGTRLPRADGLNAALRRGGRLSHRVLLLPAAL
ncbi:uncharacterized protein J5F26_002013 [Ciconia maguari]